MNWSAFNQVSFFLGDSAHSRTVYLYTGAPYVDAVSGKKALIYCCESRLG